MSRRTRLKIRPKERFTGVHHSSYANSTSHFPRSYSHLGKDIEFPTRLLPIYSNNKICYVGETIDEFFDSLPQKQINFKTLKQISISVAGQKYQSASSITNLIMFALSLCFFCLGYLFKLNKFRNKFYPKYRFKDYQGLVKIIEKFSEAQTLVINIQDNQISLQKTKLIEDAISRSNIKHFVFRNMAYLIEVQKQDDFFRRIRNKKGLNFAFVWESLVLESQKVNLVQQEVSLMNVSDDLC